jgi:ABC-type glycerol-3-phosphate transport system substrate-binding protein
VSGLGASASTPYPREAARFVSWAAGQDGLAAQVAAFPFAVPPRPDVPPAALLAGEGPQGGPFVVEALAYGRVQPFVARWPEIATEVNEALTPVWQGTQTAASAYQQVAPTINGLLTTQ